MNILYLTSGSQNGIKAVNGSKESNGDSTKKNTPKTESSLPQPHSESSSSKNESEVQNAAQVIGVLPGIPGVAQYSDTSDSDSSSSDSSIETDSFKKQVHIHIQQT